MTRAAFLRRLPAFVALALLLGALPVLHAAPAGATHTLPTPTNLQAQAGDGQVTLTWAGGENHWNYDVAHGEHPSGTLSTQIVLSTDNRTVTITGLTNDTTYRFRVRVRGTLGHSASAWTNFVTATPEPPVPTTVLGTLYLPTNLAVVAGDQRLNLTWTANIPTGVISPAHWVQYKKTTETSWTTSTSSLGRTATSHSITGLENGVAYDVRIFSVFTSNTNVVGRSNFVTGSGTPTAPSAVWEATLTADQSGAFFGCDNYDSSQDNCSSSTVLTEDEITHGGSTYTVVQLFLDTSVDELTFRVLGSGNASLTGQQIKTALSSLTLNVDGTALAVSDATVSSNYIAWTYNPVTDWTDGQTVKLSLRTAAQQSAFSDADLSALTASTSTSASGTFSALTLSPSTFAAATTDYTASVANTVTHVKITPTTNDSNATVEVGKGSSLATVTSGSGSAAIALAVGANAITVKVTAEDGSTTKTYTVTVTRAQAQQSSNADLSGLTVSAVAQGTFPPVTLDPETFAAATTEYTATVANTVAEVRITPTTSDSNATVEVGLQGQSLTTVPSGQANDDFILLSVGANAVTVKVTAQDGTTKTYTVTVTREEAQPNPAPTGLTVRRGDGRLDLSWNPPPASVGTVGNYEVEYTSSATVSNADVADVGNNDPAAGWVVALSLNANSVTPSHPITGLTSGTVYRVRVRYHLSDFTASDWAYATGTLAGPDVSKWNPTVFVQDLGGDRYGCRSGVKVSAVPGRSGGAECSELANFDGNAFSVSHVRFGTRGYRVLDLYIEPHRRTSWGETAYRVVLRVDDDSGTAELGRGMTLVLTTPGVTEKRLAFDAAERDGNTFRWPLLFEDGGLGWDQGWVRGVKVRIHQFTAGLDYVRVHYDEMRGGQPVNGFGAWRPAGVSAYFHRGLVAYIPGQFPSSDPEQGMLTTTHAKLWVGASHSGSTLEWAIGNVDGATGNFTALTADELTPAIALDPASKWTYVYVRVTNGAQVATHTIAIDPPPRTYTLNPKVSVTEGDEATLSVSLGSPAAAGGVSFTVSADYSDGGATAADVGQFAATVTVPEGRRSATVVIPTVDDDTIEDDEERFTVRVAHVGEPAWGVDPKGTATAVVTIADNDEPPEGPEPWGIEVVPGDGTLTVTWNVGARAGVDDLEIWHVLRWSQEFGVWANPRDPRAVGRNDGLSVDPGLTSYTITGLTNGVATGVFIRSMVGHRNNMSERDPSSSTWVRTKGEHTTPAAPPNTAPTVAAAIADIGELEAGTSQEIALAGVFSDADGDALTISATTSDETIADISVALDGTTLSATAVTVIGVAEGTATITVTAQDSDGNSVSDTFDVTVPAAEAAQQQQQADAVPGQVVNLSVRQTQPTRIRVEWDSPQHGGTVNSYRVVLTRDGETLSTRRPGAKKQHVVIRKLEPGATYTISVRAKNSTGLSTEATAQITLTANVSE